MTARPIDAAVARVVTRVERLLGDAALRSRDLTRDEHFEHHYLAKTFAATVGEPLWCYVRRRRIERACQLLDETTESVEEIARRVGFRNGMILYRAFRAHVGVGPSAYRRRVDDDDRRVRARAR